MKKQWFAIFAVFTLTSGALGCSRDTIDDSSSAGAASTSDEGAGGGDPAGDTAGGDTAGDTAGGDPAGDAAGGDTAAGVAADDPTAPRAAELRVLFGQTDSFSGTFILKSHKSDAQGAKVGFEVSNIDWRLAYRTATIDLTIVDANGVTGLNSRPGMAATITFGQCKGCFEFRSDTDEKEPGLILGFKDGTLDSQGYGNYFTTGGDVSKVVN